MTYTSDKEVGGLKPPTSYVIIELKKRHKVETRNYKRNGWRYYNENYLGTCVFMVK